MGFLSRTGSFSTLRPGAQTAGIKQVDVGDRRNLRRLSQNGIRHGVRRVAAQGCFQASRPRDDSARDLHGRGLRLCAHTVGHLAGSTHQHHCARGRATRNPGVRRQWHSPLYLHAWRRRDALRLSPREAFETLAEAGVWAILSLVGALSAGLALLLPPSSIGLPGWMYMLLPIITPWYARFMNRRRDRSFGSETNS